MQCYRRRLVRCRVGHFDLFEIDLHAVKSGEAMDHGPEIGHEAKERVHGDHGGCLADRSYIT